MDYKEIEFSKRVARVMSMIFPGMGLIFYSKWILGIIFIILHVLFGFFLINEFIKYLAYHTYNPDGEIKGIYEVFFLLIAVMLINWVISLICTEKVNPNE